MAGEMFNFVQITKLFGWCSNFGYWRVHTHTHVLRSQMMGADTVDLNIFVLCEVAFVLGVRIRFFSFYSIAFRVCEHVSRQRLLNNL